MSLTEKKVIGIGTVSKLSGLTLRQIRYYEQRKLIFPERTKGGTRLYSFQDVERLVEIASQMEEGFHTHDIQRLEKKKKAAEARTPVTASVRLGAIQQNGSMLSMIAAAVPLAAWFEGGLFTW